MSELSDSYRELSGLFDRLLEALRIDGAPESMIDHPVSRPNAVLASEGEGLFVPHQPGGHSETPPSVSAYLGKVERDLFGMTEKKEEPR